LLNDFKILEDKVGCPAMHAAYVLEENQHSNPFEGSLGALHFCGQPSLDVFVGKRILHVCVGVAFIEQEGQKVGRNRLPGQSS
jgi:hypothetical protein